MAAGSCHMAAVASCWLVVQKELLPLGASIARCVKVTRLMLETLSLQSTRLRRHTYNSS